MFIVTLLIASVKNQCLMLFLFNVVVMVTQLVLFSSLMNGESQSAVAQLEGTKHLCKASKYRNQRQTTAPVQLGLLTSLGAWTKPLRPKTFIRKSKILFTFSKYSVKLFSCGIVSGVENSGDAYIPNMKNISRQNWLNAVAVNDSQNDLKVDFFNWD